MDRAAGPTGSASVSPTRRDLLRAGTVVAAIAIGAAAGTTPRARAAEPSARQDREILNFALLLEYLQAAFYDEAVAHAALAGEVREFAEVVAGHERAHVAFLRKALGPNARSRPTFTFGDATRNERSFLKAAVLLENTGVLAYNGQAANLTKATLAAAAEIVSVEGRHAAWVSDLAGHPPAPRAADVGIASGEALRELRKTGFLG
jgi:rubrerythrin